MLCRSDVNKWEVNLYKCKTNFYHDLSFKGNFYHDLIITNVVRFFFLSIMELHYLHKPVEFTQGELLQMLISNKEKENFIVVKL